MFSSWILCFKSLPNCLVSICKIPKDFEVRVGFRMIEEATDNTEGRILISFSQDNDLLISKFLNFWLKGTSDPQTGKGESVNNLSFNILLKDVNQVEKEKNLILKFPIQVNVGIETPAVEAVFYYVKE